MSGNGSNRGKSSRTQKKERHKKTRMGISASERTVQKIAGKTTHAHDRRMAEVMKEFNKTKDAQETMEETE